MVRRVIRPSAYGGVNMTRKVFRRLRTCNPAGHSRARDRELHRDGAGQAPQTGDCALLLELRRRSNLAPLALATCLGEERREHRLHRPRLAFRAGGAPLAVLADRLLVAEALPALSAAVLVDRHKRREVILAQTGGQVERRSARAMPLATVFRAKKLRLRWRYFPDGGR